LIEAASDMLIGLADVPIRNDESKQSRATAVHRCGTLERPLWRHAPGGATGCFGPCAPAATGAAEGG